MSNVCQNRKSCWPCGRVFEVLEKDDARKTLRMIWMALLGLTLVFNFVAMISQGSRFLHYLNFLILAGIAVIAVQKPHAWKIFQNHCFVTFVGLAVAIAWSVLLIFVAGWEVVDKFPYFVQILFLIFAYIAIQNNIRIARVQNLPKVVPTLNDKLAGFSQVHVVERNYN